MKWLKMDLPSSWAALFVRTVMVIVVAFVVLQMKEYMDAGKFDTPATLTDAVLIAGTLFLINAILILMTPRREQQRSIVR